MKTKQQQLEFLKNLKDDDIDFFDEDILSLAK